MQVRIKDIGMLVCTDTVHPYPFNNCGGITWNFKCVGLLFITDHESTWWYWHLFYNRDILAFILQLRNTCVYVTKEVFQGSVLH